VEILPPQYIALEKYFASLVCNIDAYRPGLQNGQQMRGFSSDRQICLLTAYVQRFISAQS
jgi:hypothetical protein